MIGAVVALTLALAACSGAATRTPSSAPTSRAAQVDAPKLPSAFSRVGKRVSRATLDQIVAKWFDRPYPYMFERPGGRITIAGSTYGRFLAGSDGLVLYGGLAGAIADTKGWSTGGFYDLKPIARLAGLPIYTKKAKDRDSFSHYDPKLVRWGVQNLLPDPDRRFGRHTYNEIYRAVFSRCFRLFAEARLYLQSKRDRGRQEARAYLAAMAKPGFDGLDYLQRRFAGTLLAYQLKHNHSNLTPQIAIGFWIRRRVGGSDGELWRALKILLRRYDRDWYAKLEKRHGLEPSR